MQNTSGLKPTGADPAVEPVGGKHPTSQVTVCGKDSGAVAASLDRLRISARSSLPLHLGQLGSNAASQHGQVVGEVDHLKSP